VSMDPSMIQSLLVQQLGQGTQQPGSYGGGAAGPAMVGKTSPVDVGAQLTQKLMLMKALQGAKQRQQQIAATNGLPAANAQIANDPTMAALQQTPQMDPNLLAQLQQPPAIPPPGATPMPMTGS
jgi:hypothetical protein